MRPVVRIVFFVLSLSIGQPMGAFASGFVKDSGKIYSKISFSKTPEHSIDFQGSSTSSTYRESAWSLGLYSEIGLGWFPFKSQLSAAVSLKSITRSGSNGASDSFESRGLTDSEVTAAASLFEGELGQVFGSSVYFAVAPKLGLVIPTTGKRFREGQESQRYEDAPAGRESLVAAVDKGKWRLKPKLGMSISSSGVWVSLEGSQSQNVAPSAAEHEWGTALGASLPLNSWIQIGFAQTRSSEVVQNDKLECGYSDKIDHKWSSGLGLTFYEGAALELNYEQLVPKTSGVPSTQFTVGLSYRDL
jgi:hypothetical protein